MDLREKWDALTVLIAHWNLQCAVEYLLTWLIPLALVGILAYSVYSSYRRHAFPKEFELFCQTSYPAVQNQETLSFSSIQADFLNANGGRPMVIEGNRAYSPGITFAGLVRQAAQESKRPILEIGNVQVPIDIKLNGAGHKDEFDHAEGPYKGLRTLFPHLDRVTFENVNPLNPWLPIIIRGARILQVHISESFRGWLYFEDCWISSLQIKDCEPLQSIRISLSRCYIGHLNMGTNGCIEFSMSKGGIRELMCPPTHMPSPVLSILRIDETVILHGNPKHADEEQIGSYRNLLAHIRNRASPHTQQVISAAVFRLERRFDTGFLKLMNVAYGIFSAYNTKPGRPLIWIGSSLLLCFYLAFAFDLAVLTKECKGTVIENVSWITALCGTDIFSKVYRSFSLVLNSFMNPFSAFSDTGLLKAKTFSFNALLVIAGLLNLVWVTLAAFSVKTRFTGKASGSPGS